MEHIFIDLGFGFTISKLIPYLLTLLLGGLIVYLLRRRLRFRKRLLTILLRLTVFAVPFALYFAFFPIYEGDFSNGSERIERTAGNVEISGKKLYVITIPNCPYCKEAMERMKELKNRNPDMMIEYVVCSSDSSTMAFYRESADEKIEIRLAQNPVEMSILAQGQFPTFVLSEEHDFLKRWSNSRFGVRALDEVESVFN